MSDAAPNDVGSTEAAEAASVPAPIDWSRVSEIDLDEFFKQHPEAQRRFAGQVGTHAQRQAQQIADQRIAVETQRLRAEAQQQAVQLSKERELAQLHDTDLYAWDAQRQRYEEEQRLQKLQADAQNAHILGAAGAYADIDQRILNPLLQQLPQADAQEVYMRLQERAQQGIVGYEARQMYLQDLLAKREEVRVRAERAKWEQSQVTAEQTRREAVRRDVLAEVNGGPVVDTGAGIASPGVPSLQEWVSMTYGQRRSMMNIDPLIENRVQERAIKEGQGIPFDQLRAGGTG